MGETTVIGRRGIYTLGRAERAMMLGGAEVRISVRGGERGRDDLNGRRTRRRWYHRMRASGGEIEREGHHNTSLYGLKFDIRWEGTDFTCCTVKVFRMKSI